MTGSGAAASQPAPREAWLAATHVLLLATAILHWQGYSFGGRGHSIHVPLVRFLLDSQLYPLDPITGSFDGFATWFFHGVAALVRLSGDLEAVFFWLYFVSLLALVSGAMALSRAALGRADAGGLVALLLVSQQASLAGESSHWPGLTHAEFAGAGLVWALAAYLAGRRRVAWALTGLLVNLHALSALYLAAMLGLDGLMRRRERGLRELLEGVAALLLLGAPTFYWVLAAAGDDPIRSLPLWLSIMRERSSLHAFPFSFEPHLYARYALLVCLGWLALRASRPSGLHRQLPAFALAVAVLCALGVVFAEWIPVPALIRAQLLRSTKWLTCLLLVAIAGLALEGWRRGGAERWAAVLAVAGVVLREPTWLAVALALLLVARAPGPLPALAGWLALAAAALSGGVKAPPGLGLEALAVHFERLLAGPAPLVCLALWGLLRALPRPLPRRALAAAGAALCLGWLVPSVLASSRSELRSDDWKRVQDWAREHTPKPTLFLTPPAETGFRVFAERGTAGEWKDGTQQFFANAYAVEWWDRMRALGGQGEGYHQRGRRRLLELGRRYGAGYAVFWSGRPLVLPRVFETPDWVVYELREMTPEEREAFDR